MPKSKDTTKEYTVKVATHNHQGKAVEKGDKIVLTESQAQWLQKMGVV